MVLIKDNESAPSIHEKEKPGTKNLCTGYLYAAAMAAAACRNATTRPSSRTIFFKIFFFR